MTYAIIETGGKQLRVEPGRFYDVERLSAEPDADVVIDRVLYVESDGAVSVGQPFVEGATVQATVMQHLRGRKIIVYKMRPKKKTRKKQGHRQELTRLMINSIDLGGQAGGKASAASSSKAAKTVEASAEPAAEDAED